MQLQFPVYRRGNTLVLHVRIGGRQVKRSLRTLDPNLAKVRATQMLGQFMAGELAAAQPPAQAWAMSEPESGALANEQGRLNPERAFVNACAVQPLASPLKAEDRVNQSHMRRRIPQLPDHEKHQLAVVFAEYGQIKKLRKVTQNDYASYAKEMVEFWGPVFIAFLLLATILFFDLMGSYYCSCGDFRLNCSFGVKKLTSVACWIKICSLGGN